MYRLPRQVLLICGCMFALAGQAAPDPLAEAQRASDMGLYAKSAKLLKPLAAKGNAQAQFKLATLYYSGRGVSVNLKEAARLYRLSAEQGHATAQSNLATMYYRGEGVRKDYVMAHMWKNIASTRVEGDKQLRYAEQLNELAKNMTARQIAEARELSRECRANNFKGCKRKR
jgi:TPR repeat protein